MQKNLRNIHTNKHGTLEIHTLCFYILLLPVATGLSGLIGDISFLNYIAVFYIIEAYLNRRMRLSFKKEFTFLYAYMGYTIVSIIWSGQYEISWYITTFMLNAFILLLAASREYSDLEKQYIRNAVYISAFFVIFVALLNIQSIETYRLSIVLTSKMDPNDFGCGLCLIISYLLNEIREKRKILPCGLILLLLALIVITGSRGAMMMAVGVMIVWLLYLVQSKQWKSLLKISSVALVAFLILYCSLPDYLRARLDVFKLLADGGSGRFAIWEAAFRKFATSDFLHQLCGYGHGSFRAVVQYTATGHSAPYVSHNMFVNALIEGGFIGCCMLIFAFGVGVAYAVKKRNLTALLCIVGFALEGMTLDAQVYRIFPIAFLTNCFCGDNKTTGSFSYTFKVSVVIPVYNVKAYLQECLSAICNQTYRNIEIILVDDGSTDGSGLLCDEYAKTDSRIKVVHKQNGGLSSARNAGLAVATGEYVTFIDSDDYVTQDMIERLCAVMPRCDVATCAITSNVAQLSTQKAKAHQLLTGKQAIQCILREKTITTSASAKLFKRSLFDGIAFPEGKIYEDYATIYKVFDRAKTVACMREAKYYYRYNPTGLTKCGFNPKRLDYFDVSKEVRAFMQEKYPTLERYARMREVRYAISFYKEMLTSGYEDEATECKFRNIIKRGIIEYLFSGYALLSKLFGVCIAVSPRLAKKIFKRKAL